MQVVGYNQSSGKSCWSNTDQQSQSIAKSITGFLKCGYSRLMKEVQIIRLHKSEQIQQD